MQLIAQNEWCISEKSASMLLPILLSQLKGEYKPPEKPEIMAYGYLGTDFKRVSQEDKVSKIAQYHLEGAISKSYWYGTSILYLESEIRLNENDDLVLAHLVRINSGGGSPSGIPSFLEFTKTLTKPIFGAIEGDCASAALWASVGFTKLYATDESCIIGSIGVESRIVNDTAYYEKQGIKIITIRPPESPDKNKIFDDAKEGNTAAYSEILLSPTAKKFIADVKANRNVTDLDGKVFTGNIYTASDAVANGLIDGIKNIKDIFAELLASVQPKQINDMSFNLGTMLNGVFGGKKSAEMPENEVAANLETIEAKLRSEIAAEITAANAQEKEQYQAQISTLSANLATISANLSQKDAIIASQNAKMVELSTVFAQKLVAPTVEANSGIAPDAILTAPQAAATIQKTLMIKYGK